MEKKQNAAPIAKIDAEEVHTKNVISLTLLW